jgi:protein involved in ribonucleotide reduction
LAGHNFYSAISGCRVSGSISGTGEGAAGGSGTYVGGLVGFNESNSTISDCYTTGIVTGIGNYVGGLAGAASISTISGCYSSCNVSGEGNGINRYGQYVGGLVGDNYNGSTIANSYATGDVTGTYRNVGGLVGSAGGTSEISNSYATGNVSGGDDNVGGLVGVSSGSINSSNKIFYSTISDCYATGNVNGSNNYVGGLVGNAGEFSIIKNCYAAGNVSGEQYIGGITGYNEGTIYNCISVNNSVIALTNTAYINRIFGAEQAYGNSYGNNYALNSMTVQSNGSNVSVINGSNAAGTGKDIATLQSHAFYNNGNNWWNSGAWSINPPSGIWKICDGENLPFLRWQGIECNDETGITDISQNTMLSIYPNPTDGIFTIDNGNLPATIKLYNMLGQEVLTQTVNGKTEININHLPQGVYNVRVFSEGKVVGNSKIMK